MRYSSRILPILIIVAAAATFTFAGCKKKDMSLKLNEPRNIRGVVSYKRSFGDLNEKHLNVAQAIGIRVLSSREEAEKMREQLQPITTNELYAVDSLTHSIPYLIPGAASLLDTIGHNFLDSLTAKGLNPNKIIDVYKRQLQYCKEIINLFIMNHSWHLTLKVNQDINQ